MPRGARINLIAYAVDPAAALCAVGGARFGVTDADLQRSKQRRGSRGGPRLVVARLTPRVISLPSPFDGSFGFVEAWPALWSSQPMIVLARPLNAHRGANRARKQGSIFGAVVVLLRPHEHRRRRRRCCPAFARGWRPCARSMVAPRRAWLGAQEGPAHFDEAKAAVEGDGKLIAWEFPRLQPTVDRLGIHAALSFAASRHPSNQPGRFQRHTKQRRVLRRKQSIDSRSSHQLAFSRADPPAHEQSARSWRPSTLFRQRGISMRSPPISKSIRSNFA